MIGRTVVPLLMLAVSAAAAENAGEFFELRIRPLLAKKCFACHTSSRMGGLGMASRESLLKGGQSGPAVVPGMPEESLLIQAVNHTHERLKMPMQGERLSEKEISDLVAWVKAGAVWPEHQASASSKAKGPVITPEQRAFWAFQPIRKPVPPAVKDRAWAKSPIDQFILAKLEAKGLRPNRPADRRDLIRRAYFDLVGLPPKPKEVEAFLSDRSAGAFAKIVDRLLASPHYGERWGRYWLDVARYSDEEMDSEVHKPYPNAYRYRDWVIQAFNDDMPYDVFVKAQIAGDLLDPNHKDRYIPGLGFYALSPEMQDDRVDVTTRGFLGLTGACAQCHDHKFDPIPTRDYYALLGVFKSTKVSEYRLAPPEQVEKYKRHEKRIEEQRLRIRDFLYAQASQLAEILAEQTPQYLRAARQVLGPAHEDLTRAAAQHGLDRETLERWVRYLQSGRKDHSYLNGWQEETFDLQKFKEQVQGVLKERKQVDETNALRKAQAKAKGPKAQAEVVALEPEKYYLWRDLFFNDFYGNVFKQEDDGILYYGPNRGYYESDGSIERFLDGPWKAHLQALRAELQTLQKALPSVYPFVHTIEDVEKPKNEHIRIGGKPEELGEEAPRSFLSIFCQGEPKPFQKGSGRLELAEAIASPDNPLAARVMINRIWDRHFGAGIVRTTSNFGRMGDSPSHPELLDYLASRFVENRWSIKAMHREIMLSAAYSLSADASEKNASVDAENRLLWRANRRRLDAEALRDSLLFVSGELEATAGGPPQPLNEAGNHRRSVYGFVSRRQQDPTMALFDFPNPNASAEERVTTATPLQQLFFLNSDFILERAGNLARQLAAEAASEEAVRVRRVYGMLFGRNPSTAELQLGLEFLKSGAGAWPRYAKILLSSNEFLFVN